MDPTAEITKKNIYTFYNRYKRRKIKPYKNNNKAKKEQTKTTNKN